MSEYEIVDAIASHISLMQTWMTLFFTIFTTYMVAAYLSGSDLGRAQMWIVTISFCAAQGLVILSYHETGLRFIELAQDLTAINPNRIYSFSAGYLWPSTALLLVLTCGALKFMFDIRRANTE
jgi:hypothetical protein